MKISRERVVEILDEYINYYKKAFLKDETSAVRAKTLQYVKDRIQQLEDET